MRSFKPYLCGLSSGRGDGAGMVGDRAEARRADAVPWLSSLCSELSFSLALGLWFSLSESSEGLAAADMSSAAFSSTVIVESEWRMIGSRALWAGSR